jgi:hypothetical protein
MGPIAGDLGIEARRGEARRGRRTSSSPTADPRTPFPGGAIVAQRGRSTPSTAVTGGGSPARQRGRRQRRVNERPRRRRRRWRSRVVPRSRGGGSRGRAACHATRVWTTPQRGRTSGGVAMTTGGPGDNDVEAPAARATDCRRRLPREAARVGGGGRRRQPMRTVDDDGEQLEWLCHPTRVGRRGRQPTRAGGGLIGSKRRTRPASNESGMGAAAAIDHDNDDLLNQQSTNNGGRRRRWWWRRGGGLRIAKIFQGVGGGGRGGGLR